MYNLEETVDNFDFHSEYLRYACLPHRQEKFFMLYIRRSPADYAVKSWSRRILLHFFAQYCTGYSTVYTVSHCAVKYIHYSIHGGECAILSIYTI